MKTRLQLTTVTVALVSVAFLVGCSSSTGSTPPTADSSPASEGVTPTLELGVEPVEEAPLPPVGFSKTPHISEFCQVIESVSEVSTFAQNNGLAIDAMTAMPVVEDGRRSVACSSTGFVVTVTDAADEAKAAEIAADLAQLDAVLPGEESEPVSVGQGNGNFYFSGDDKMSTGQLSLFAGNRIVQVLVFSFDHPIDEAIVKDQVLKMADVAQQLSFENILWD